MITHIFKLIWNKKGANALISSEILLAFIALFAVLSFMFYNTDRLKKPLGFETDNMKYVRFGNLEHLDSAQRAEALVLLKTSLEDLELVESVSFSHEVSPFLNSNWCNRQDINGLRIFACYSVVEHNFVETNGMNIVAGRSFREEDKTSTYPVMIVNQTFLKETFGDTNMLDSLIQFSNNERKIIGIIDEYKYNGEFEASENRILMLHSTKHDPNFTMTNAYLRLSPEADISYEEKISNVIEGVLKTPNFVIQDAPLLRSRSNREKWIPIVILLSMCGFLCLNVALGLFGVLSYAISKRRGEVGLRRAMGAHSTDITMQFILEVVLLASIAVTIGLVFAIQIPLLKVIDIEASIFYRGIMWSIVIILVVVTLCALYPSLQASRIHPATALHED